MTIKQTLAPCPFCGGEAMAFPRTCEQETPYDAADRAFPMVRCQTCYAQANGENWGEKSTAITAWNTRPPLPPEGKDAMREALEAAAERFREYEAHHAAGARATAHPPYDASDHAHAVKKLKRNREMAELCEAAILGGDSDDPPCTDCGGTGTTYQTEEPCACVTAPALSSTHTRAEVIEEAGPAAEIATLARRILALAPSAGLYVGIKIEPARALSIPGKGGGL